jgi:maltose O-acetyltransferase
MKTDKERMIVGEPYDGISEEMMNLCNNTKKILHKLNVTEYHREKFESVMRELFPNSAKTFAVEPSFYCDYGDLIYAGENVFINYDGIILDGGSVTIGDGTLIAPGVHIYTAQHPLDIANL